VVAGLKDLEPRVSGTRDSRQRLPIISRAELFAVSTFARTVKAMSDQMHHRRPAEQKPEGSPWRARWHEVVFEADTPAGKRFDLALLVIILLSVTAVCLESVPELRIAHGPMLRAAEWAFTILFTIEYAVRLATVRRPLRYAVSFYGLVDLLAILPTYLSALIPGSQSLLVIRALRLLRVFRILKLTHFVGETRLLGAAMRASARKIVVFLTVVITTVLIAGALMYLIEGEENGFTNIPLSVYWAVVTMSTVGFGDIVPQTVLGRFVASILMILGYAIIAVPTGIVTVELSAAAKAATNTQACPSCGASRHDDDARYCKLCGAKL
jgi:voltage-gated potassium channel